MRDDAMRRLRAANPVPSTPRVLPVDELIADWGDRAGEGPTSTTARPSPNRRAPWRTTGLSVALALLVGTGSAAAALTAFTGHPIPQSPDTVSVRPAAGTTHVSTARAVDPDGGPPWALRIGTAPGGLQCLGVGQVDDGRLGIVGLDGVFREVAPAGADDCGVPARGTESTLATRTFVGKTTKRSVTVIYGVTGPGVGTIAVQYIDGMTARPTIAADGAFVVARRGTLDEQRPTIATTPSDPKAHFGMLTTLGTPLPASRQGCGTPHEPEKCHRTRPFVASEGVR